MIESVSVAETAVASFAGQIAHIFVVQINVHKGAQLAFAGEQVLAQVGKRLVSSIERAR
jgi:hypothetical protein